MSNRGKDNSGGGGGGGSGGFGAFWRKFTTRFKKNKQDGGGGAERSLTAEEKNKLAADVASKALGLNKKAQEQVAKAIAAEMQRRHEEREKRRRELMISTKVQLPWGPKSATHEETEEPAPPSPEAKIPASAPKVLPKRASPGAALFPIKMELKEGAKQTKSAKDHEPDTWDDSMWKPVAAVGPLSTVSEIDQQRQKFLAKSGALHKKASPKVAVTKKAAMATGPPSVSASEPSSSQSASFGSQPTAIQMDDEAVKEIHAHTLGKILQNILVEASSQPQKQKVSKKPQDMSPEELIDLRRRDPTSWDQHTRQNTLISFGLTTPTEEDAERAKKVKTRRKRTKLHFEDETEVVEAPIGRDFQFNEKMSKTHGVLKK